MADLFGQPDISLADMIAEVENEIRMRERVYANRVAERRMTQASADRKIRIMEAVADKLRELAEEEG